MEMENNCKTIVYLTTNIKNKKIYIGVHDTTNPTKWDFYLGNGIYANRPSSISHPKTPFHYAVKKYGFDAFVRSTIAIFDKREDALKLEAEIVNEDFIKREDTYNIALGGGDPPRNDKPVFQYDLKGNFIQKFNTQLDAETSIGLRSGVCSAIKTKTICGGYLWSDKKVQKLNLEDFLVVNQKVCIFVYDSSGNFLKKYDSISSFCRDKKVTLGPVQRAIKTKTKVKNCYISLEKISHFIKPKIKKSDPKIYQYTLDGIFVKEWKSCLEVQRVLGKNYARLSFKIRLGNPICGDFQWSREKLNSMAPVKKRSSTKKIAQYDLQGNFIKIWNSVRECRQEFGNVSRVLSGKVSHCKGFTFRYLNS